MVAAHAGGPVEPIPDFLPVLGHLDGVLIVLAGIYLAIRLIPGEVPEAPRRRADGPVRRRSFPAIRPVMAAFVVRRRSSISSPAGDIPCGRGPGPYALRRVLGTGAEPRLGRSEGAGSAAKPSISAEAGA